MPPLSNAGPRQFQLESNFLENYGRCGSSEGIPKKDEPKSYLEPAPSFQNFLVLVQWA